MTNSVSIGSAFLDQRIVGGAIDNTPIGAATPSTARFTQAAVTQNVVLPKSSTYGIKVDESSPVFCWRDIIGNVQPKATGAGSPTRAVYAGGNVADYSFIANDVCDFVFHMPHDWAVGTDLHWHIHWSHNGTSISGNAVFDFYYQFARRDGLFGAEKNLTITYDTANISTTPQYKHQVHETQMTATAATATMYATSALEVDGLIVGTLKLTTLPTIGGGGKLFVHTCDVHYQSTNIGTKNKASDFYA